jgi:hypothetical protein
VLGALVLGLVASLSWGVADFIGGVEARRLPVLSVLLISQPVGLSAAAVWALALAACHHRWSTWRWLRRLPARS